jgi:uncharacterized protein YcbK (DUF882 family)
MYKYFKDSEIQNLNAGLVQMLDQARDIAGIPFIITSGYRTAEHNAEVGGVDGSSHIKGLAADIRFTNWNEKFLIKKALYAVGFVRIGNGKGHVHCDIDTLKDVNIEWDEYD